MIQQAFDSLHQVLDEIMVGYAEASGQKKQRYLKQFSEILRMSDTIIDQWLLVEEKLAIIRLSLDNNEEAIHAPQEAEPDMPASEEQEMDFHLAMMLQRGEGYFNLFMFSQAAEHFRQVIQSVPDCLEAHLYLAMTAMHIQQWGVAQQHFQLVVQHSNNPLWQAIGWNALGCLAALRRDFERAKQLFHVASQTDPTFEDPLLNLQACQEAPGQQISLYFGSAKLSCL